MKRAASCALIVWLAVACTPKSSGNEAAPKGSVIAVVRATSALNVTRVNVALDPANVSQDLDRDPATGSFVGVIMSATGTQTLTATAYDSGNNVVGRSQPVVVAVIQSSTVSAFIKIYDVTGSPAVPDHGPVITSVVASKVNPAVSEAITLTATAVDPDGDPLTWAWTSSCTGTSFTAPAAATTDWSSATTGPCTLTIRATAKSLSDGVSLNVTVFPAAANTGAISVTGIFVEQPVITSISVYDYTSYTNTTIDRFGTDATVHLPVHPGQRLSIWASGTWYSGSDAGSLTPAFTLSDNCGGTVQWYGSSYWDWTAPNTAAVCILTVSETVDSLIDQFPIAIVIPASTGALTLYDALTAPELDGSKWAGPGAFSAGVSDGAAVLAVDVANQESKSIHGTVYNASANVPYVNDQQRVTTLKADITIPSGSITRSGSSQVRANVRLFYQPPENRLTFPGGNLNLFQAEVGLIDRGNGLQVFRHFAHCDDPSCVTVTSTGVTISDPVGFTAGSNGVGWGPAAAYDTPYTVTLSYDETTGLFQWSIAGAFLEGELTGTADPTLYLLNNSTWNQGVALAGTGFSQGQIAVRTFDPSLAGGGTGKITARFDNVWVGYNNAAATLYDDFNGADGNSGPTELSRAKWSSGGSRSMMPGDVAGRGLVLQEQLTNASSNPMSIGQSLPLLDPASVDTLQADVTMNTTYNGSAYLDGRFYNDGTPGTTAPNVNQPNSAVGDIEARVQLNPTSNSASWLVLRCGLATGGCSVIGQGTVASVLAPVGTHTLLVQWDPIARTFTFGADWTFVTIDPQIAANGMTSAAPYVGPANSPWRDIGSWVAAPPAMTSPGIGSGWARFSNVYVGP